MPNSLVRFFVLFCIRLHFCNLILGESAFVAEDCHIFLHACGFVLGVYIKNTVGIHFESYFYLWNPGWCWRHLKSKYAEAVVIFSHGSLALKYLYLYFLLIILGSGEYLTHLEWFC
jgi:hypothetical protein